MYRKLLAEKGSSVLDEVTAIMAELPLRNGVEAAVLSTEDGLSIQRISSQGTRLAAVAGFMKTAAQQAFTMMGLDKAEELIIRGGEQHVLISSSFYASRSKLILTIVFDGALFYEDIVAETVAAIQQAMEK